MSHEYHHSRPSDDETPPTCIEEPTPHDAEPHPPSHDPFCWDSLGNSKRRFNFDLIPKVRRNYFQIITFVFIVTVLSWSDG